MVRFKVTLDLKVFRLLVGSEISSEPSYILFNTAVSSEWGFPKKCPANCPCKKYDCFSKNFQETCGFSEGFCDMMKKDSPKMKVNWVRVYQDPRDPTQKVGCSTPERPTRRYIEAHADLYKQAKDVSEASVASASYFCFPFQHLWDRSTFLGSSIKKYSSGPWLL